MASLRGDTFEVHINTGTAGSPTWVLIGKVISFDKQSSRQTTSRAYFGSDTPDTTKGPRETTLTMQGTRDLADAGQTALFAALDADPEQDVELLVLYDQSNGYRRTFQVNDEGHTTAPLDFQDFSISCTPTGDASDSIGSS